MRGKEKIKCVECGSMNVIKKGVRNNKFEVKPVFKCNDCFKKFTFSKIKNKTYPANVIMDCVSNYNLGYSLNESRKLTAKKFKIKVSEKTIYNWVKEFNNICSYHRIRGKAIKLFKPSEVFLNKIFFHQQPYRFCLHKAKTEIFVNEYFDALKEYLFDIARNCPNDLFNRVNIRGSQFKLDVDFSKVEVFRKENYACRLASLALSAAKNNRERHDAIERFMLCNDTCTIACEVPIYLFLDEIDISVFNFIGIKLNNKTISNNQNNDYNKNAIIKNNFNNEKIKNAITGHIDFVQLKFGSVYVLDYKPDASKVNAISQLFVYALALSIRTGIWLRNFKCAWFDEDGYYEFAPSDIVLRFGKVPRFRVREFFVRNKARRYFTSKEFQNSRTNFEATSHGFKGKRLEFRNKKLWILGRDLVVQAPDLGMVLGLGFENWENVWMEVV